MAISSDESDLNRRLEFMGIDANAKASLRKLKPLIRKAIGPALDTFYSRVKNAPETNRHFKNSQHMAHAKGKQEAHWDAIADAEYGESYGRTVRVIGRTHARLGLEPRWYIGGYALVMEQLIHAVVKEQWPRFLGRSGENAEVAARLLSVLVKAAMLDMDLAISTYLDALDEQRKVAEHERAEAQQHQNAALAALSKALLGLSNGELHARVTGDLAPEFDELKGNFNSSIKKLDDAMQSVSASISAMNVGTQEISAASDDLSRRTEQNAASLEETAAALHEITTTVNKTADGVRHAQEVVAKAKHDAEHGGTVVRQAVGAMDKIEQSSREITQIIGVIDEIAFQTNLLALNAGVEAARAGDAGRGFAVVASEVRALAQRSAEAAKQIKGLISTSSAQVQEGVKLVGESGQSLERIVQQVAEINGVVADIAASAREQATGLQEVNTAVSEMDQVTQQNAAMAEQATAAAQSLAKEGEQLANAISQFKTNGETADPIRSQLRKAAPHVYAARPGSTAAKSSGRTQPTIPSRTVSNHTGTGSAPKRKSVGASNDGWDEF